jgi:Alginate lyase
MKLNYLNLSAICICIGLGGFVLGKLTSGNAEVSEHDKLLAKSERLIQQRSIDAGSHSITRQKSNRPNRPSGPGNHSSPTQEPSSMSLDQKLVHLEAISRGTNPLTRKRALLEWIDSLAPEEYEAAVEKFRRLRLENQFKDRNSDYYMLMAAWGEVDPVAALAYNTEKKDGYGHGAATVLTAWAIRDADAAVAWVKSNHQGDEANPFIVDMVNGIVRTDPVRAASLVQDLPSGEARHEGLDAMTSHLVDIGEEAAKKWISGLSGQSLRAAATANLILAMESSDDDLAFSQSNIDRLNSLANDLTGDAVMDFVWATKDEIPELAVDQIEKIRDESTRNDLYIETLNSWIESDEGSAIKWINSANLPASVIASLNETLAQN